MRLPRMTVRRWMILIALTSPFCMVFYACREVSHALAATYGPDGVIELPGRLDAELNAAAQALAAGHMAEAEARYRAAGAISGRLAWINADRGWNRLTRADEVRAGLRQALVAQGRSP